MRSAIGSFLVAGFLVIHPAAAAFVLDYELFPHAAGRLSSGRIADMDVVGTTIYAAARSDGLVVIDVSDAHAPIEIGRLDTAGQTRGVGVFGDHALVGDEGPGLWLVDVSNPAVPIVVGSFTTLGDTYVIDVEGTLAVVQESVGFEIFDVSMPSAPVLLGSYTGSAGNLVLRGATVYQIDPTAGLRIIDISAPASPAVIGMLDPGGDFGGDLDVVGSVAYVSRLHTSFDCSLLARGFWIVDVSDPSMPALLAHETGYGGRVVSVVGDRAFLGSGDCYHGGGFTHVVDVSTPSAPTRVGQLLSDGNIECLRAEGGSLYVGDWFGLQAYDGQTLVTPRPLGTLGLADPIGFDGLGSIAYVVDRNEGLRVVDLTYPVSPTVSGTFDPGEEAFEVVADGAYAYLRTATRLVVVDVSTPSAPTETAVMDRLSDIDIVGGHLYGASDTSLDVVDVSDPTQPELVGSLPLVDPRSITTDGSFAYLRTGPPSSNAVIRVVDVTAPNAPVAIATVDFGEAVNVTDLLVDGTTLYAASSDQQGFYVVDVSAPQSPLLVHYERTPGYGITDLALANGFLYASPWKGGVDIYDVATPAAPRLVGTAHPGVVRDLAVQGELLLVTEAGRLSVLSRHEPGPLVATPEFPVREDRLRVAPNPTTGVASIDLGGRTISGADLYDVAGRLVRRIEAPAGDALTWDGRNERGRPVAPGVYVLRMRTPEGAQSARIVVTR